jgi:hypothetical protein
LLEALDAENTSARGTACRYLPVTIDYRNDTARLPAGTGELVDAQIVSCRNDLLMARPL